MVYNKNCRQFIAENNWMNNLAFNMHIDDIKYYYPFSDETTINVLLWKYGHKNRLPLMQMNIDDIGNVNVPSPVNGQALVYNTSTTQWIAGTVATDPTSSSNFAAILTMDIGA